MISLAEIEGLKTRGEVLQFIDDRFAGDPAKFIGDINSAVNKLLQSDLDQARRLIEHLIPCFRHLPEYHRLRLTAIEARYAHATGQTKAALAGYRKAVTGLQTVRNFEGAARARQGLMDVYMYLGRYRMALETGQKALNYFRRKGNDFNAARVMTNIGNIYHRLDKNRLALKYYDRAGEIFKKTSGIPLAILDFNRANIHTNLNHLDQAENLYRSAADLFREHKMDLALARTEYSLAYLYFLADKYTLAITTFEQVMDTFEKAGDARAQATTRLDLAEINIHLNQFGSAVMLGEMTAASCKKLHLRYEQGKAAFFVAESYRQLGDYTQASISLRQAERLFEAEDNRLWLGMVCLSRGRLKSAAHRYKEAMATAAEAQRLFRESGDERRSLDAEIAKMEIELKAGNIPEAMSRGRRLNKRKLTSYQRYFMNNLMGMGHLRLGQTDTALACFQRAISIIEKTLINIYPDEVRFFFALDKFPTYLSAVDCLLQLDRVEESFLQHSRALAVLNQKFIPETALRREVPGQLLETRDGLRASLKKLSRVPDSSERQLSELGSLSGEEHRLWEVERKIRSYLYPADLTHDLPVMAGDSLSRQPRRDESILSFSCVGEKVGAFQVDSGGTRYIRCPVDRGQLETAIREMHFLMEKAVHTPGGRVDSKKAIDYYLNQLFNWLIAPLELKSSIRRLSIVPEGLFAQIPFAALLDAAHQWLKDNYAIRLAVNPLDQGMKSRRPKIGARQRCAIFTPENSGLPLIEWEGLEIKRMFPQAVLYSGGDANIENMKKELNKCEGVWLL